MPSEQTPPDRAAMGRIGAHESWARTTDRTGRTAPARAAFEQRFLDEADGDPVRAEHLRKAYFARLALKSAQSRSRTARRQAAAELRAAADDLEAQDEPRGGSAA